MSRWHFQDRVDAAPVESAEDAVETARLRANGQQLRNELIGRGLLRTREQRGLDGQLDRDLWA